MTVKSPLEMLKETIPEDLEDLLIDEIPKGEALLGQLEEESPEWNMVAPSLLQMYQVLNHRLGVACKLLGYPPNQMQWPDSEPLSLVAKALPGIAATEWYQYQLGAMLMGCNHSWVEINTWPLVTHVVKSQKSDASE
ncbi:MAG: hypothetical protein JW810_06610 [Sedimentisphaerales bacterium]|nr:hypothetical protein [Sedimentisphaerales bacterium]